MYSDVFISLESPTTQLCVVRHYNLPQSLDMFSYDVTLYRTFSQHVCFTYTYF